MRNDTARVVQYNGRMFQFSIRSLLLATAAVAVLVWVLFAPPQWVGMLAMFAVHLLIPPITVASVFFHRGYAQAFFIGVFPWGAATLFCLSFYIHEILEDGDWLDVFTFSIRPDDAIQAKLMLGPPLAIMLVSGLAAMAVRWWVIAPAGSSSRKERSSE